MLKNVALKRALKNTIFPVLTVVNKFIPKNDKNILLYSSNFGVTHNLRPVKDYLLENGYDKKYNIYCGVESMKYAGDEEGVTYLTPMKAILKFFTTKHVYYTTGQIPIKPSSKQTVIHLDHGTTAIKTGNLLTNINNGDDFYFTYYTVPSELYRPVKKKEFLCSDENVKINGEPVNDIFFKPFEKYDLGNYKKIGLWTPTFRQSDYLGYDDSQEELLPMFTPEDYEELNEACKKNDIKLFVKLHSGQNVDGLKKKHFSHLEIFTNKDFVEKGYELYAFLMQTDFILGDYSSVFLQYLLVNRPMAFVVPDFEEYKERRGFIFENVTDYMPGPFIKEKKQLYSFFEDMANDKDEYKEERIRVRDAIHYYQDGENCRRALELSGIYN